MIEVLTTIVIGIFSVFLFLAMCLLGWFLVGALIYVIACLPIELILWKANVRRDVRDRFDSFALRISAVLGIMGAIVGGNMAISNGILMATRQAPITIVKAEVRRYELLDYDPPKHFYVELRDVKTNQVYQRVYVSKHCNEYRKLEIHGEYNLQVQVHEQEGKQWLVFTNLAQELCQ